VYVVSIKPSMMLRGALIVTVSISCDKVVMVDGVLTVDSRVVLESRAHCRQRRGR
jgi:hypothetical protein